MRDGNPQKYRSEALQFDSDDRLTSYGSLMSAGYTGAGLRAWKEAGGKRTYFLYDGSTPIVEVSAQGHPTAVNTWGALGLVSRWTPAAGHVYYQFDPQGSVAHRSNGSGGLLGGGNGSDVYDAYGVQVAGDHGDVYGYKWQWGYYRDAETETALGGGAYSSVYLLTHRYYDPLEGRFLTRDPIGYAGGINLYGYVGGNPVNAADPSGLLVLPTSVNEENSATISTWEELGWVKPPPFAWPINRDKRRRTLYHYTSREGLQSILRSGFLRPSLGFGGSKAAYHGEGQYFSNQEPESVVARRKCDVPRLQAIFQRKIEILSNVVDEGSGVKQRPVPVKGWRRLEAPVPPPERGLDRRSSRPRTERPERRTPSSEARSAAATVPEP